MINKSFLLFGKGMSLEVQIEEFLNLLLEANILFRDGVFYYLEEGKAGEFFQARLQLLVKQEREVDALTRFIEVHLRSQSIGPQLRGDVWQLLEQLSRLQRLLVKNLLNFELEMPDFPVAMHAYLRHLSGSVFQAVGTCLEAGHMFFSQTEKVGEYLSKVAFHEKEADKIALSLGREIAAAEVSLDRKMHVRRFVEMIDEPANKAEEIAAWLAIFFIRRAPMTHPSDFFVE
ncbi:MAG: hypothetical protein H7832_13995 [Magnetococcus sp. DMHC-6]